MRANISMEDGDDRLVDVKTLSVFRAHLGDALEMRKQPSPALRFVLAFKSGRLDACLNTMPQRVTPEWKMMVKEEWRDSRVRVQEKMDDSAMQTPERSARTSTSSSSRRNKSSSNSGKKKTKKRSSTKKKKLKRSAVKTGTTIVGASRTRVRVSRHGSVFIG